MTRDAPASPRSQVLPRPTDRLTLAGALQVSPICLGTVGESRAISHAFDLGINFFFLTADMHWPLYDATRRGLMDLFRRSPSVRDQVVVAVVGYPAQSEFSHMPFEETLGYTLGLGHIDLTVAGGSYRSDFAARKEAFEVHKKDFGARAFGTSFHDREMAAEAIREELVDIAFIRYNVLHPGAETDVFPHVAPSSRALLYNFTSSHPHISPELFPKLGLNADYWQPDITDYYRWVLARPELDGILCAPRTVAELDALDRALAAGPLTDEQYTYIRDLTDLAGGKATLVEDPPTTA